MPAPAADFILGMMNPYKGFDPNESAKAAVAAGQLGEARAGRRQRAEQFNLENARANSYLDLANRQFSAGQANDLRDKQIGAYTRFQAAVDSGDTEQADLALNELSMLGVGVEKYGGQQGAKQVPQTPSVMDPQTASNPAMGVQPSPTPTPPPSPPMNRADAATDRALDQLAQDATVDSADPMAAMGAPQVGRPGPARANGQATPPPQTSSTSAPLRYGDPGYQPGPPGPRDWQTPDEKRLGLKAGALEPQPGDASPGTYGSPEYARRVEGVPEPAPQSEATGPRPSPARTSTLPGDEPKPVGAPGSKDSPLIQGYRLKFGDKVIDVDPQSIAERQRTRVAQVFQPLIDSAATPEEKRSALQAKYTAMNMVGSVKPEQAIAAGLDFYTGNLDRQAREKRATIIGGKAVSKDGYAGVDTSKEEQKRSLDVGKYVREKIINPESQRYNIKGIREELAQGKDALAKANSPDGLGQFASKATLQKLLMKGALTDKDVARLENATGVYNRMLQWVNNWTGDGQVPPDVLNAIRRIVVEKNKILREREIEAAEGIANQVRADPALRNVATDEEIEGWASAGSESVLGPQKKTKRAKGPMEAGAPAGKAPAEKTRKPGAANAAARRLLGK